MGANLGWRRLVAGLVAVLASPVLAVVLAFPGAQAGDPPVDPPVPTVELPATISALIGQDVGIDLQFRNTSLSHTGFGPYIDLQLPLGADGDDGLAFKSATYLGAAVTATQLVAAGTDGPGGSSCIVHPYAVDNSNTPVRVCGLSLGQAYVVLRLPFGSFTPGQPAAVVHVNTSLSENADVGTPLSIVANGGFQFGADALANPTTDPSILGSTAASILTPTIMTISKTYNGPESETATGPNFPESYTIRVTIAPGQTVTDLVASDTLPANMQFISVDATSPASSPVSTPSTSTPGGTLAVKFASVLGTGGEDAKVTFHFYIPRLDASTPTPAAVLDPATGAFAPSLDTAGATGTWTPLDTPRDPTIEVTADPATHHLTDKSVAIQKGVRLAIDTGAHGVSPGDTLEWTMDIQVSDYFALGNVVLYDRLGDGTRWDLSAPRLQVDGNGYSSGAAPVASANYTVSDPESGITPIVIRLSDELVARVADGRLVGGCVDPDSGTAAPNCAPGYDNGPTTATITFRSIVQRTYATGRQVVEGDTLANLASVTGDVLDNVSFDPTGHSIGDGSSAVATDYGAASSIPIERGALSKSIYAINGNTSIPPAVHVAPGDQITYELSQDFPTSRTDGFRITDFLPLPIFKADTVTTFDPDPADPAVAPPTGTAQYGPSDDFHSLSMVVDSVTVHAPTPSILIDDTANSVEFHYGDYAQFPSIKSTADILFTVTVSTEPFADGLLLTNQARSETRNDAGDPQTADAIIQITLDQPVLTITKGVVGTDRAGAVFTPSTTGPVAFDAITAPPSVTCPGWSGGDVTSAGLADSPIDSNLGGVDAGDYVRFAVVVQNTGHSSAYEVQIADTRPAGFAVPGSGLNLCVANGHGQAIGATDLGGGLFGSGIQLNDGGSGSLAPGFSGATPNATGTNVAVITYTLQVATSAVPSTVIENTASLEDFTNKTGAASHLATALIDKAFVTTAPPAISKALVGTSRHNGPAVVVGEIVTYRVTLSVPEGTLPAATVVDTLPDGMAYVGCTDGSPILPSAGVSTDLAGGFAAACNAPTDPTVGAGGQLVTFDLGTVTNATTDNGPLETIVITYDAVVLNVAGNNRETPTHLHNQASFSWSGGNLTAPPVADVIVHEPLLSVQKDAALDPGDVGDAGDRVNYTITVTNPSSALDPSGADAFDVALTDAIPPDMTYDGSSGWTQTAGGPAVTLTVSGDTRTLSATWLKIAQGESAVLHFSATIDSTAKPSELLRNTADVTWTSLPGDHFTLPGLSTYNDTSTERTGDAGNPGGGLNDYRASSHADETVPTATVTKTFEGTDQVSTTGYNVAIGEKVTYKVKMTFPEGTESNARLVDTLPAGLAFVRCTTISTPPADLHTDLAGGFAAACGTPTSNPGHVVTFTLGNVTNVNADNLTAETLEITYEAVVLNLGGAGGNLRGQPLVNHAVLYWTGGNSSLAAGHSVTVVEPIMNVTKTVDKLVGDAGDEFTFQVDITNPTDAGGHGATAFEVAWTDDLPTGLTYEGGSLTTTTCATAPATPVASGQHLSATWAEFAEGGSCTLQYKAVLADNVPAGKKYKNAADLTWTSLPGDHFTLPGLSAYNDISTERTGNQSDPGGTANTYDSPSAVTVEVAQLAPVKSIVATSETGTTDPYVAIGEVIRYRVAVVIPEGATPAVSIKDTLGAGLQFLNDNTTKVAFVTSAATPWAAGVGMTSSTISNPALQVTGNQNWAGHPTYVLPGSAITGTASAPSFDFGTLTNYDRDGTPGSPDSELVVVEFNVLVTNVIGNQGGTTLTDQASIWAGSPDQVKLQDSNSVSRTVGEPIIVNGTEFTKAVTTPAANSGDAGDPITYTITVKNRNTATAPAYDYDLLDTLPADVDVVTTPPTVGVVCTSGTYSNLSSGDLVHVTFTQINPNKQCVVTVSSTIVTTERAYKNFSNTAAGTYTSLPGTHGSDGGGTGSTAPGDPSTPTGERTGSLAPALNDYTNTRTVSLQLKPLAIVKNAATLPNAPIGATEVFDLVVTLPEGTTRHLSLTDSLPWGLDPVSYQVITLAADSTWSGGSRLAADFSGALGLATESATPTDSSHRAWTIFFAGNDSGEVVVPADGSINDDRFLVRITARVANIADNQTTTPALSNTSLVTYTNPANGNPINASSGAQTVTVFEPAISVTKTSPTSAPHYGEIVTYTLTVSDAGGARDIAAYDVTLTDPIPAGMTYVPGSLTKINGAASLDATTHSDVGGITLYFATFPLTSTSSWTYQATVDGPPGSHPDLTTSIMNTATVNWTSLFGVDANERTGADGVGGALNDYRAIATKTETVTGADMAISKTDGRTTATAGAVLSYVIHYVNNGNQDATGVVITETVPAGTTFNSGASTAGWSCVASTCTHAAGTGTVAVAGSGDVTFAVTVVDPLPPTTYTQISNTATIADDGTHGADPTDDNSATDVDDLPPVDLWLEKTASPARPGDHQLVDFTVTIHNADPTNTATNVEVTDHVPAALSLVTTIPAAGTTYDTDSGIWSIPSLGPSASKTLVIRVRVMSTDDVTNVAEITRSDQRDPDSTPNNGVTTEDDWASATIDPTEADLSVTKAVSNDHPDVGSNVTYTIVAHNGGPDDATGVKVVDALPEGTTFISANPPGDWDTDTWTIGTLNKNTSATLTIVASVDRLGSIKNTAVVSADPFDPNLTNNTDDVTFDQLVDLSVGKTVDIAAPNVGTNTTFTVTVSNAGPGTANGVVISDPLPAGLTLVGNTPSQGSYSESTHDWTVGSIPAGHSATLALEVKVETAGAKTNTATVGHVDEPQTRTDNDSAFVTITPPEADLEVVKTVSDAKPDIGDTVDFTVTVKNKGLDDATGVALSDLLPVGLSYDHSSVSQGSYAAGTGLWTVGNLDFGVTATLHLFAVVGGGGDHTNSAAVSASDQYDPDPDNNSDDAFLTTREADIAVAKTVSDTTPNVGDTVTFTVTATNAGPDPASQLVLHDELPVGLTYVSSSADHGTYSSTTHDWTVGALAEGPEPGASLTITARVVASGTLHNTAAVGHLLQRDNNPDNDTASADVVVDPAADLSVTKTVNETHPDVGSHVTFTIVAHNNGPDDAPGTKVTDALPDGLTLVTAKPSVGSFAADTWTIGTLNKNSSATLTIVASVDRLGSITNTATVSADPYDPDPTNNSDHVAFDQQVDLAVRKTVDVAAPNVGANTTFTVTVSNAGPGTANGVVISDPLPAGLTLVGNTPSQGSYSDSTHDWTVGSIDSGHSATLTLEVKVETAGAKTNTATVGHVNEPQTRTDNDSDSATVTPLQADLEVLKTVAVARPDVGDDDAFTITVTNHGGATATHVVLDDLLPTGLSFVGADASQGTYDDGTGIWTVGTIANGASVTLAVNARVDAGGDYRNTASITASDQYDPDPLNNTDSADLSTRVADIAVTKTAGKPAPAVGSTVTFTVTATNRGPDAATQLVIHDALPAGLTYVSAAAAQGAYNSATGDWTVGGLARDADTTLTITARVVASGKFANTAAVSHLLQRDPVPANDTATASVVAPAAADLSLTKTVDDSSPDHGKTVTFTLKTSNAGPDSASGIVVRDKLPAGLVYVSSAGQGTYDAATGNWKVGALDKGGEATIRIKAKVNSEGPIVNVAEVFASSRPDPDSTPGNGVAGEDDRATASLNARGSADLSLTKHVNQTMVAIGGQVTYTLKVTNHGPDGATGVVVRDTLPAGLTYVSSAGGTYNRTTGAWTVGSLDKGDSETLTITVRVGQAGSIVNTAEVVAEDQLDPNSVPDNHVAGENDQGSVTVGGARATPPPTAVGPDSAPGPTGSLAFVLGAIALAVAGFFLIGASRRYAFVRARAVTRRRR